MPEISMLFHSSHTPHIIGVFKGGGWGDEMIRVILCACNGGAAFEYPGVYVPQRARFADLAYYSILIEII